MKGWTEVKRLLLNKLRSELEKSNRLSLNKKSIIHPTVQLDGARINGIVEIAEGARLLLGIRINAESKISIGRFTSINGPNTDIYSKLDPIRIGAFCSIARNVSIQGFNHRYDGLTTYHIHQNVFGENRTKDIYSNGPIEIGHDVWIGTQCVIGSGAKIGNGAVIAANSTVVDEVPPFAIAGGSPAKVIRYRFDESTIKKIQELAWWDWSLEKINKEKALFEKPIDQIL